MLNVSRIIQTLNRSALEFKYVKQSSMMNRLLSMYRVDDSIYLCTNKPREIEIDEKTLRFNQVKENSKPIVLMLGWLYATTKDVNKYSKLYTDQGMDVLVGRISLTDFLSKKRAAGFSQKILDILKINEASYNEIFLHTFSAGGGVWGGVQRQIKKDLEKYGNIPKSVIGQVWDSTGRNDKIAVALPIALFPNRPILQSFVKATLWTYLTLHRPLHHFYVDSINNVYQNMSRAPALIFVSKVDPMGTEDFNEKIAEIWRANGVNVTYKCFENSPHVKHYQVHPEEYLKHLHDLWKLVKLLERN